MSSAVICPLLRCCRDRDRYLCILHCQIADNIAYCIVARCSRCEFVALDYVVNRALTWECDTALYYCSDLITSDKACHIISGIAVCSSIICELFTLCRDRHCLRLDSQSSRFLCDHIVGCYIFITVLDLVACCYRVVALKCICYISHAPGRLCNKFITCKQCSRCNSDCSVAMCTAVICPLLRCCRDRNSHFGLLHRQLAVSSCYCVVVRISCSELI